VVLIIFVIELGYYLMFISKPVEIVALSKIQIYFFQNMRHQLRQSSVQVISGHFFLPNFFLMDLANSPDWSL